MRIVKGLLLVGFLLAFEPLQARAGWQSLGNVSGVRVLPQGVDLKVGAARVRVVALSSNVVRVRYAPEGTLPAEHSFAVLPRAFPLPPMVEVQESADAVTLKDVYKRQTRISAVGEWLAIACMRTGRP